MKVYSLYYKEEFVAAFSNRGWAVDYGKLHYPDGAWDCNIIEEYLSKTPYNMFPSSPKSEKPNIIPKGQMTNQTPCNYRTPSKPQAICMVSPHNSKLEYIDEQMVIINGVQYQRVEEPKPPTLYNTLYVRSSMYSSVCDTVCEIVEKWLPLEGCHELKSYDYSEGWNDCLQHLKENLK
jgi:hypothetical protein